MAISYQAERQLFNLIQEHTNSSRNSNKQINLGSQELIDRLQHQEK